MKYLVSLLLFSHSFYLNAQEKNSVDTVNLQANLVDSIVALCFNQKDIKPLNQLISSGRITNNWMRTRLLCAKVSVATYINPFGKNNQPEVVSASKIHLNYYDSIYNQAECGAKILTKYNRHNFLKNLIYQYNRKLDSELTVLYKKSKKELKSIGYKPERDGFGLGAYYTLGKDKWIGLDVSIASYYQSVSSLSYECNNKKRVYFPSNRSIQSVNALTFGYSKNLDTNLHDFSFSLIDLNSPFVFVPAKFGLQTSPNSNQKRYYYRPSIGISVGVISLSYAYNLMFSKSVRSTREKHMFSFKLTYPIVNYRYRSK